MTEKAEHPVLVPVDFSPHSEAALLHAVGVAGCMEQPLVVLHVVHDPGDMPGYYSRALKKKHLDRIEEFRPEGLASRILGHGDIVGLVKDFEEVIDEKKAEEDAEKLLLGDFTFDDFLKQLKVMKKMGSLTDIIGKLPLGQFGEILLRRQMNIPFENAVLPRAEAFSQHLTPSITGVSTLPDGVCISSYSTTGVTTVGLTAAALTAIAVPMFLGQADKARGMGEETMRPLMGVGRR